MHAHHRQLVRAFYGQAAPHLLQEAIVLWKNTLSSYSPEQRQAVAEEYCRLVTEAEELLAQKLAYRPITQASADS